MESIGQRVSGAYAPCSGNVFGAGLQPLFFELGTCIQQGRQPEVDTFQGARSVGLSYSLMESQVAGRARSVDAVCDDRINAYQAEINEHLGL